MKPSYLRENVLAWFDECGRHDLPWQKNPTPYRVWLSEIMLQQTQVATVIPYFLKFTANFPTIKKLSQAPIDEVLHLWSGLGYYARARNLYKTAIIINRDFNNRFPTTLEGLMALPGIGRSTAGAILSLSLNKPFPILDGNVKRVLARYHAISGSPSDKKVENEFWQHANLHINDHRARDYTQAMMDLGSLVCTRSSPNCQQCPLQKKCRAFKLNKVMDFPEKKIKKKLSNKHYYFLLIKNGNKFLLEKRPPTGIWGGLWCFPQCDYEDNWQEFCFNNFGITPIKFATQAIIRHTFSHFHLIMHPIIITMQKQTPLIRDNSALCWYDTKNPGTIGLSKPVSDLLGISQYDTQTIL